MPANWTVDLRRLLRTLPTRSGPARPAAAPSGADDHVPDLDGLRGVATLVVIFAHAVPVLWALLHGGYPFTRFDWGAFYAAHAGWVAVDLFFVLSGFLITGILLRAKGRPGYYKHFYVRRALRIMPLYYAVLLALFALSLTRVPWLAVNPGECLAHAAYLGNYWRSIAVATGQPVECGSLRVYWSLAIEEQFYLAWPLVVASASRAWLGRLCAAGVVVAVGCRWGIMAVPMADPWLAYALTPCRMDALLIGALVALAASGGLPRATLARRGWMLLGVASAAAAAVWVKNGGPFCHARAMATFGYTAFDVLFAGVLLLILAGQPAGWRVLRLRVLRCVGAHCYAVYLVHFPIIMLGHHLFKTESVRAFLLPASEAVGFTGPLYAAYFGFVLGLSLLLARLTRVVIERPFLKLRTRFPMGGSAPRGEA